ncbi:MAG: radical SAM protein [Candidatus Lokiarchaeota archaeon]
MRILYVNPSRIQSGLDAIIKGPPLGLISIAAMVPDHQAKLIDLKVDNISDKALKREFKKSDVIAITSMTPQISNAIEIATMAKKLKVITLIGGYHPTLDPDYVVNQDSIDFVIRGEGEHTFKEIIEYIKTHGNDKQSPELRKIKGVSYKKDGEIIHNPDRPLERNLDNFPLPRRDLLDDSKYIYLGAQVAQIESSRGCPHSCKFCCIHKMWKDPTNHVMYRTKSISRIMKELYDISWKNDFVFFCEDNFTINVKRTKKILETIIKSGLPNKLYFSCQSRIDTLYNNPWLIDLMYEAGMRQVFLGIESLHQQSLDAMNKKNTTAKMTREVVNMLQSRGISIFGGIIIGFPGETKTMVRETIQFARNLHLTCMQFTPITAFPGTEFYNEMKAKNMITSYNYKNYNLFHPMMRTEHLTPQEMYQLVAEAYASTYLEKEWLEVLIKRYINPLGKYTWMYKNIPRFIKVVMKEGVQMLRSQGITKDILSNEMKELMRNGHHIEEIISGNSNNA